MIFYESALLATSCTAYLWDTALCYKCILGLRCELWKSGANLIKIPKFDQRHKQQRERICWWKISRPIRSVIPCRICVWPATRKRLPTLVHSFVTSNILQTVFLSPPPPTVQFSNAVIAFIESCDVSHSLYSWLVVAWFLVVCGPVGT